MMQAVALTMSLAGFACLALSMTRHQSEVLARPLPPLQGHMLRGLGLVLIAAGLPVAIRALGAGLGTVAWFGYLSLAAGTIFLVLLWLRQRPRKR